METSHRLKKANLIPEERKVQNRNPQNRKDSLHTGKWVLSIELQDACLHIPIHQRTRTYLRFAHRFSSLLFGVAPAPQVFTLIAKEVKRDTNTPILGRLDDEVSFPRGSITQYKCCGESDRIPGLDNKSRQVRADCNSCSLL